LTQVLVFVKLFEGKTEGNINFALKTLPINFMLLPKRTLLNPATPAQKTPPYFNKRY